ncbi:lytic transglycosylase domain-containing protein [Aromatoleum anaerobium]|uniref:Lytic transglycosylase domain-containing protein n=1 Tax=Aromatoleum anaerobium TaxID=182180 RepID=A0ABX1PQK3_9RHOO|nr:lytic transglycosylase domain-containing protein [Aromatoleum anaerobium]MCK0508622.1 lytic transglycosylase domain-containing protein [Aromatoleum anaerobium]
MTPNATRRAFLVQASAALALLAVPSRSHARAQARKTPPAYPPIPPAYRHVAESLALPAAILYGVAIQESVMRWGTVSLPWPWTLNVRAVPRRYGAYETAVADLERILAQGVRNVDCGTMQVNWRYHADKLRTPALALEPWHNLKVAGFILLECRATTPSWFDAVGAYHSPGDAERAARYARSVFRHIGRIRDA